MHLLAISRLSALAIALLAVFGAPRAATSQSRASAPRGIVVVELFTSEGCSSCPPADAFLKKLSAGQPLSEAEIVPLEEHVDYWNHQGWTDPYSSPFFSARQQAYADAFRNNSVYTPQMIVDGQAEFSGNQADRVRQAILFAASVPKAEVVLTLPRVPDGAASASLNIKITNLPSSARQEPAELWLAITEKNLQSQVSAGENSGETLQHAPVVRLLKKVGTVPDSGEYTRDLNVNLHSSWKKENLSIVVFLARKNSHHIVGAASAPIL